MAWWSLVTYCDNPVYIEGSGVRKIGSLSCICVLSRVGAGVQTIVKRQRPTNHSRCHGDNYASGRSGIR